MRSKLLFVLFLLISACTPQPANGQDTPVTSPPPDELPASEPVTNPFAPQPGDAEWSRGPAYIEEASLIIRESFPPQIVLTLAGDLPTPCNQLRAEISLPDRENKIVVDVYSVIDPEQMCTQVLEPFDESIELGTFPGGHYTVWVNGDMVGEFDS